MSEPSWTIERHIEVGSTNRVAKAAAQRGAVDRTVVVAERQSEGRGRGENAWGSPPGGLYASVLLRDVGAGLAPLLPLAAGVALLRTLDTLDVAVASWLKWPNDLLVGAAGDPGPRGKAGGVLVETVSSGARIDHAVVGFGVNLHTQRADLPADTDPPAVSLADFAERVPDAGLFLDVLLTGFGHVLTAYRRYPARLVDVVAPRLAWMGDRVRVVRTDGAVVLGRLVGLTDTGALRLDMGLGGEETLDAWDVRHLRPTK